MRHWRGLAAAGLALGMLVGPAAPSLAAPGVRPASAWNCPAAHPIKGNVNTARHTRIYHVPGSRYYKQTKPEICFAKAADAVAAGFRAPFK